MEDKREAAQPDMEDEPDTADIAAYIDADMASDTAAGMETGEPAAFAADCKDKAGMMQDSLQEAVLPQAEAAEPIEN